MSDRTLVSNAAAEKSLFSAWPCPLLRVRRAPQWLSADVVSGVLRAADLLIIFLAGVAANFVRFNAVEMDELALYGTICATILSANILHVFGLYRFDELLSPFYQSRQLLLGWSVVILCLIAFGFLTKTAAEASRLWIGLWFVCGYLTLLFCRALFKRWIWRSQRAGYLTRNVVVVGDGKHLARLVEHVRRNEEVSGIRLVGLFNGSKGRVPCDVKDLPVLGTVEDLARFTRECPIDHVIIALPWNADDGQLDQMKKLKNLPVDVQVCPDLGGLHLTHRKLPHLAGMPLLNLFEKPLTGWSCVVKAVEDRLIAGLILPFIAPVMGVIALAIKLGSPGPILFKQKRLGFNNEVIEVFKFRSMYHAEDGARVEQAKKDDHRVTRVGHFIRRTSLDELPQLFNVLKGDMSIVGPRPHAVAHNERYAKLIDEYIGRHRVKPGITGWAQVHGLRGETETLEKMQKRVQFDLHYIENWSLAFDLRIILKTICVGFVHANAY